MRKRARLCRSTNTRYASASPARALATKARSVISIRLFFRLCVLGPVSKLRAETEVAVNGGFRGREAQTSVDLFQVHPLVRGARGRLVTYLDFHDRMDLPNRAAGGTDHAAVLRVNHEVTTDTNRLIGVDPSPEDIGVPLALFANPGCGFNDHRFVDAVHRVSHQVEVPVHIGGIGEMTIGG